MAYCVFIFLLIERVTYISAARCRYDKCATAVLLLCYYSSNSIIVLVARVWAVLEVNMYMYCAKRSKNKLSRLETPTV